jgi:hypothetical protein
MGARQQRGIWRLVYAECDKALIKLVLPGADLTLRDAQAKRSPLRRAKKDAGLPTHIVGTSGKGDRNVPVEITGMQKRAESAHRKMGILRLRSG